MTNFLWDNIFKRDQQKKNTLTVLSQCFLFSSLSQKELKFVESIVNHRNYQVGESVFKQGEIGVGMYLIEEGCVDIYVEDGNLQDQPDDEVKSVFVTRLKKGDFFGELALIEDQGRRTATAIASTEARLIGFFKPDLLEISERSPSTGVKILFKLSEILGRRLKETSVKITEMRRQFERLRES